MSKKTKILVIILFVITVLLAIVAVLVTQRLNQDSTIPIQSIPQGCGEDRCCNGVGGECGGGTVCTANGNGNQEYGCANGLTCCSGQCSTDSTCGGTSGGACTAPCDFVQGSGASASASYGVIHYCESFQCSSASDTGVCAQRCDVSPIGPPSTNQWAYDGTGQNFSYNSGALDFDPECYDRQIDWFTSGGQFAGYKLKAKTKSGDECTRIQNLCGDGIVQAGEECDDGNNIDNDSCSNTCTRNQLCGNGVVDAGEQCDDGDQDNNDECRNDCTINTQICGNNICNTGETCDGNTICGPDNGGFTPGECRASCDYCGDGLLHPGEECDDGNGIDNDLCKNDCTLPLVPECGNDICEAGESCDGATLCIADNGGFTPGECRATCNFCGDGVAQAGEECDDGNNIDNDTCSNSCTLVPVTLECGNNVCDIGETCDGNLLCGEDKGTFGEGECTLSCNYCGDGIRQSGEQCDDGNNVDNDACSNTCVRKVFCGDGIVEGDEQCDDGNDIDDDSCSNSCKINVPEECGNSMCDAGETCDNNIACVSDITGFQPGECRLSCNFCGDGIVQAGEECDDGNLSNQDSCTSACKKIGPPPVICGNGIIEPGEECEPGVAGSCGPGATCGRSCTCSPTTPGLCGSACTTDAECPNEHICSEGTCKLNSCVVAGSLSGTSLICTNNECDIVECGSTCGEGGACPVGLTCSSDNRCIVPYCLNGRCENVCELPPTALISDEVDRYIISLFLILIGVLIYRLNGGERILNLLNLTADTNVGKTIGLGFVKDKVSSLQRISNERYYRERNKEEFEDRFEN